MCILFKQGCIKLIKSGSEDILLYFKFYSTNILSSTTVSNIDNKKCHFRIICEGSCDHVILKL